MDAAQDGGDLRRVGEDIAMSQDDRLRLALGHPGADRQMGAGAVDEGLVGQMGRLDGGTFPQP